MEHDAGRLLSGINSRVVRHARWFVLGWIAIVAALNLAVPQLEEVARGDDTPSIPASAPSQQALASLERAFPGEGADTVFVVLASPGRLGPADLDTYADLVRVVAGATDAVAGVTSFVQDPALRQSLVSQDGQAAYFVVSLLDPRGSPASRDQIDRVRDLLAAQSVGDLAVHVTGPSATENDLGRQVEDSLTVVTIATLGLIGLILILTLRSVSACVLALATIGITMGAARGVVALLGKLDLIPISAYTGTFMVAVVLGAGTDYAVFQLLRFYEARRDGDDAPRALSRALAGVNRVVVGSALTVIVATSAMALAQLGPFATTGPAIAVGVAVTLVVSLTFTPAVMTLMIKRGWLQPRDATASDRRWQRFAKLVVARPGMLLAVGLAALLGLSALAPQVRSEFDFRSVQPADTDSNLGYRALADHFPLNELIPDYVVLSGEVDLRTAAGVNAIERVAEAIDQVPDVVQVRALTRPLGVPVPPAGLTALSDPSFVEPAPFYLSPDGRTARLVVLGGADSFSRAAMGRVDRIERAARAAVEGTPLATGSVAVTGLAATNVDTDRLAHNDFLIVAGVALLAVLLILIWLLRSPVVAVVLIGSVVLSFSAALGLGVLYWQVFLGHDMVWTMPVIAFLILVAVGSDYNLLMMSRMRAVARDGNPDGIRHAIVSTGRVISAAALIFAASMFAMMVSPLITIQQVGFVIGCGLLIDALIVRSLIVPACARLLGTRLWWPEKPNHPRLPDDSGAEEVAAPIAVTA